MASTDEATSRPLRIVIAGGGTGGHLYPGLAVARELLARRPDAQVSFVGTARGIESRIVPEEGFELDTIRSAGLKGKRLGSLLRGFGLLPLSAIDAWRVLSRRRPDVVIGVGGYSSGPVVLLASLRGVPSMLLEQNATPGITNRLLARVVRAAAVSFEPTLSYFRGRGFVSGNPVRSEFFAIGPRPGGSSTSNVLVFGGSQGAHAINQAMVEAAPYLARLSEPLSIVHQTGERDFETVKQGYARAGLDARLAPYLREMHREMSDADLIVCRAGATTIAEVAAAGRAAVFIPLPGAVDNHQAQNAAILSRAGAAVLLEQATLSGEALAREIVALAGDEPRRARMADTARGFARPDAARLIVDRVLALAEG
jgi:UDP-N-acetylglucosamine--N-acetylmuramyl-(pentapeptide) pyrophosphoryl-undecaprenol N-acetylglucosamine transferase